MFFKSRQHLHYKGGLLGKVYVAEFFFTRCPTICPIMNQNMKTMSKFVERKDFGIASFTIDPDHDRPHILKNIRKCISAILPLGIF